MSVHPSAGARVPADQLVDVVGLLNAYHDLHPDAADPAAARELRHQRPSRLVDSPARFNEAHVLAITQAICDYRRGQGIDGPLYLGRDTHALSEPAFMTALEVLAANGVATMIDDEDGYTPTPAISHAILTHNRGRTSGLADGIVITPSHNPPDDGGFKYNPPTGGPADTAITRWIQDRANELLASGASRVPRVPYQRARQAPTTHAYDYVGAYVGDLASRGRHGRRSRHRAPHRRRSARRREPRLLARHLRAVRPRDRGRERRDRSGLRVHAARLGRPDPHGLLVAACDGQADCTEGSLRRRVRQRSRRGPARDRHPHRADEPQPLSRRGHLLSVHAPSRVARRCGRRQDRRQQQHHRPGRDAKSGRSLVEVPVGFKWFVPGLLDGSARDRRRGERGRVVPPRATAPRGRPTRTESSSRSWPSR